MYFLLICKLCIWILLPISYLQLHISAIIAHWFITMQTIVLWLKQNVCWTFVNTDNCNIDSIQNVWFHKLYFYVPMHITDDKKHSLIMCPPNSRVNLTLYRVGQMWTKIHCHGFYYWYCNISCAPKYLLCATTITEQQNNYILGRPCCHTTVLCYTTKPFVYRYCQFRWNSNFKRYFSSGDEWCITLYVMYAHPHGKGDFTSNDMVQIVESYNMTTFECGMWSQFLRIIPTWWLKWKIQQYRYV